MAEKTVRRTVTVDIPENIDRLLENVAHLLLYPTVEAFLEKEVVKWTLDEIFSAWEAFVDPDNLKKRYGLVEENENNPIPASQPDKKMIIEVLEDSTDKLSLLFQNKIFQELLEENPPIKRIIYNAQQDLVELKEKLEEFKESEA